MNCDFINSLIAEQKVELRKLLNEETEQPKYHVKIKFWDEAKTQIKSLVEFKGDQQHGISLVWWENGNKSFKIEYQNDQLHGKSLGWYENGNKWWEYEYQNGVKVK